MEEAWKSRRRRGRLLEEEVNRDGHWVRVFTSRGEPWPIIEQWASESGYRMVAMKSHRRLYVKGSESPFYQTYVDIKRSQEGSGLTISSWIRVGLLPRVFSLFTLGMHMNPEPTGFHGVRARRAACRDLNVLLERFRQNPILGSGGFHPADWDLSVHVLAVAMAVPTLFFLVPVAAKIEIRAGLSNPLLEMMGRQLGAIASYALILLVAQWAIAPRIPRPLFRWIGALFCFGAFSLMCVFHFTWTATETIETKFAYHCLHHFNEDRCRNLVHDLSVKDRELVSSRLRLLQKELALGPVQAK